jgi:cytochrome c oxidase subunit 4
MTRSHSLSLAGHFKVFAALVALTAATTGVAYLDLGVFNPIVALLIAAAKASLVALFFMHLARSNHRTQLAAGAGVLWLSILIVLALSDVLTRGWFPQPNPW